MPSARSWSIARISWKQFSNVVAHELTHVADGEHKIARSLEFRKLVEPRIEKLRGVMTKIGLNEHITGEAEKRTDLIYAQGLPSYYSTASIQETLAEFVRAMLFDVKFKPPADIKDFIIKRLIEADTQDDPSIALYRGGKLARLNKDYKNAYIQLGEAIKLDANFAEAYIERGKVLAAVNQLQLAVDDFSKALGLMSRYDWQLHVPSYERGKALAILGRYDEALVDLYVARNLSPKMAGLVSTIAQAEFLRDMQAKQKSK